MIKKAFCWKCKKFTHHVWMKVTGIALGVCKRRDHDLNSILRKVRTKDPTRFSVGPVELSGVSLKGDQNVNAGIHRAAVTRVVH